MKFAEFTVAKGHITETGCALVWQLDPSDVHVHGFNTLNEVISYLFTKTDDFNITFYQTPRGRDFNVWITPFGGAA